jgi:hypothetical protein
VQQKFHLAIEHMFLWINVAAMAQNEAVLPEVTSIFFGIDTTGYSHSIMDRLRVCVTDFRAPIKRILKPCICLIYYYIPLAHPPLKYIYLTIYRFTKFFVSILFTSILNSQTWRAISPIYTAFHRLLQGLRWTERSTKLTAAHKHYYALHQNGRSLVPILTAAKYFHKERLMASSCS